MENKRKILLISGSPRKGNTDFILNKIFKDIKAEKEIIFLREKSIRHCLGCLSCDKSNKCAVQDDMQEIYPKIMDADILVAGTPNYFDNVPGLMKDFIDRTNPFYETDILKDKKMISIVTGGGKIKNSKKVGQQALKYFQDAHKMELVGEYYFKGLGLNDIKNDQKSSKAIDRIIKKINSL